MTVVTKTLRDDSSHRGMTCMRQMYGRREQSSSASTPMWHEHCTWCAYTMPFSASPETPHDVLPGLISHSFCQCTTTLQAEAKLNYDILNPKPKPAIVIMGAFRDRCSGSEYTPCVHVCMTVGTVWQYTCIGSMHRAALLLMQLYVCCECMCTHSLIHMVCSLSNVTQVAATSLNESTSW